ncbi:cutinase-domain-containing protein [Mycena olivaceomarginata]|nr:cutinase-domain-containing protein [Mycena olivaceomarginata]
MVSHFWDNNQGTDRCLRWAWHIYFSAEPLCADGMKTFLQLHTEGGLPGSELAGIVAFIRERLVDVGENPLTTEDDQQLREEAGLHCPPTLQSPSTEEPLALTPTPPLTSVKLQPSLPRNSCKQAHGIQLLFARGTFETGNVGARVGPLLIAQLRDVFDTSITVQGVDYDATLLGYFQGGSPSGSATLVTLINNVVSMCPFTKVILGGYSQGAQLVHNAASEISAASSSSERDPDHVGFGDASPPVANIPSEKVDNFCHTGDIICTGAGGAAEHLDYDMDVAAATTFILARVRG